MSTKDNMRVWNHAKTTDTSATKNVNQGGRNITSIQTLWPIKKGTELWGPVGLGWGFEILEDRFDTGIPIMTRAKEDGTAPTLICDSKIHTIRIKLWYIEDGKTGALESYGHTPFIYGSKYGASQDDEAPKKSLSDAIKKALSMLGFCSDIYMGMFDDREYVESIKVAEQIEKQETSATEVQALRDETTDYVKRHIETLKTSSSKPEIVGIFRSTKAYLQPRTKNKTIADICESGLAAIDAAASARSLELAEKEKANG